MKLFRTDHDRQPYAIIIGGNKMGYALAEALSDKGFLITVIGKETDSYEVAATSRTMSALRGDATDEAVLRQAGIDKAGTVFVMTDSDNDNMMIAQFVRQKYPNQKLLARLNDPQKEVAYRAFAIQTVFPEAFFAKEIYDSFGTWMTEEQQ